MFYGDWSESDVTTSLARKSATMFVAEIRAYTLLKSSFEFD